VLFYHSSCAEPGIVGIARVASAPYPDPTQFDPKSPYYDARSALADHRDASGLKSAGKTGSIARLH
jgi:predicted RNA-binding protein with PUA-like domain